uniref:Uncharacterized protein n=1 Tax=Rhizophora mucronata TaxID=61149 RepID=A0A2P2PGP8_RHIMU
MISLECWIKAYILIISTFVILDQNVGFPSDCLVLNNISGCKDAQCRMYLSFFLLLVCITRILHLVPTKKD